MFVADDNTIYANMSKCNILRRSCAWSDKSVYFWTKRTAE